MRQNRFLSASSYCCLANSSLTTGLGTGDVKPEEDETLWWVPLELLTVDKAGKKSVDHKAVLEGRETTIKIDNVADATYKINAETTGVCMSTACLLSGFH